MLFVSVCTTWVHLDYGGHKKVLDPLELQLHVVAHSRVGAGNQS